MNKTLITVLILINALSLNILSMDNSENIKQVLRLGFQAKLRKEKPADIFSNTQNPVRARLMTDLGRQAQGYFWYNEKKFQETLNRAHALSPITKPEAKIVSKIASDYEIEFPWVYEKVGRFHHSIKYPLDLSLMIGQCMMGYGALINHHFTMKLGLAIALTSMSIDIPLKSMMWIEDKNIQKICSIKSKLVEKVPRLPYAE